MEQGSFVILFELSLSAVRSLKFDYDGASVTFMLGCPAKYWLSLIKYTDQLESRNVKLAFINE